MHNTLKDKAVFGALLLCIYVVFDLMVMVSDESGIPNQSRNFFLTLRYLSIFFKFGKK